MSDEGIDLAWAKPSVAEIEGVGAHFVMRYFSHDSSKNLTKEEVTAYHNAGIKTGVVWESTAGRATAGHAAGVADAQEAEKQRKAVGLPADMVIHFAVDEDTTWAKVQPYFDGAISVIGLSRVGTYGGVKVIAGAYGHGIKYLWQTAAWSAGVWSSHATIQQRGGTVLHGSADLDYAMVADYGQYPRPTKSTTPPPHKSPYEPFPTPATFNVGHKSPIIAAMHDRLVAVGCNHYKSSANKDIVGQGDKDSYEAWQRKCGFSGSGATWPPGKTTWDKLKVPNV